MVDAFSLSNYHTIYSLQNNMSSLFGIFAFLHDLNLEYQSRYNLTGPSRNEDLFPLSYIDQHYTKPSKASFVSQYDVCDFRIKFDSPFILTGYSIMNSIMDNGNTHPKSWEIYGVKDNEKYLIETQKNQSFCMTTDGFCKTQQINGYKLKRIPKGYKEFIFNQTESSAKKNYVVIESLDLFGVLCGIGQECKFHAITCILRKRNNIFVHTVIFLLYI